MKYFLIFLTGLFSVANASADEKPEYTDYCKQLEHEIQGRKHGFLAGNVTYYVGGFHASWNLIEDETIGYQNKENQCMYLLLQEAKKPRDMPLRMVKD